MLAIYTQEDGTVLKQNFDDLVAEAEAIGYYPNETLMNYLLDCYRADESGFEGPFEKWLDALQETYFE